MKCLSNKIKTNLLYLFSTMFTILSVSVELSANPLRVSPQASFQCQLELSGEAKNNYIEQIGADLNNLLNKWLPLLKDKNSKELESPAQIEVIQQYLLKAHCFLNTDGMLIYFENFEPFLKQSKKNVKLKNLLNKALESINKAEREKIQKILLEIQLPLEQ